MASSTEGKPESKAAESKPEAKPAESKEAEENQDPSLKYKTWVLKVSIHCEGCKRKVEKTLRNIQGVYEAYADLKQQKATVKANLHVNAETLIKKLVKKGRHAELWPEKAEQKEKKKGKSKNKEKQGAQQNSEEANNNNGGDKEKETVKIEVSESKSCESGSTSKNNDEGCNVVSKSNEGGGGGAAAAATCKNGGQVKEPKPEGKQTVTFVDGDQSPVAEKKGGGCGGESEGNGGGGKKNKKGKKGNAGGNFDEGSGEHSSDAAPAYIGSHFTGYYNRPNGPVPIHSSANHSPPRQHPVYEHPTYYHAPPVYVTSYNTAYPSSTYTASYYASPPPYSFSYMHPGHAGEHPPPPLDSYTYSSYTPPPSDSFEMFSDENPNACSTM